jgi:hypothetical protein
MIIDVYHAEGYVTSWIDDEKKIMVVKTLNLNLCHHAKTLFAANLRALEEFKPKHIILDKSMAVGLQDPKEEETWLRTTLFPEYKKRGLQRVITIFPRNHIARFGTNNWLNIGKEFGFEFIEMPCLEEAFLYIKNIQKSPVFFLPKPASGCFGFIQNGPSAAGKI